jgi:hypothetical protein
VTTRLGTRVFVMALGSCAFAPSRTVVAPARSPALSATQVSGPKPWSWTRAFPGPTRIALIRARFADTTRGVPIRYGWEIGACEQPDTFHAIEDASGDAPDPRPGEIVALPRRRSWFVDAEGCALRLVVRGTNGGPPALEEVSIVEGARDVLAESFPEGGRDEEGFEATIDGRYATAYRGRPGRGRWSLTYRLRRTEVVDRVRIVLGEDATLIPGRPRTYAVTHAPLRWSIETSVDGETFTVVGSSSDGARLPVRRPFVWIEPRPIVALRLVLFGATGESGRPSLAAAPVVREVAAYTEGDPRPVLPEPWLLSVNANPAASRAEGPGGELANDVYFAKFIQQRFSSFAAGVARDDRLARMLGPRGELLPAEPGPDDGRALESIEGDDPGFDERWLAASWPPPITILSGSNDWDYARASYRPAKGRMTWNPLESSERGGMGGLAKAVAARVAPFVGFCGGAQILALLEARRDRRGHEIDAILRRNGGRPIRGVATDAALVRAWPGETRPRVEIRFDPKDPLFADVAAHGRTTSRAFAVSHFDYVRPQAFAPGGPLERLELVATSLACAQSPVAALQAAAREPRCIQVTQAFRSRAGPWRSARDDVAPCDRCTGPWRSARDDVAPCDRCTGPWRSARNDVAPCDRCTGPWPLVGTQFHPEQRDFATVEGDDDPASTADPRLFLASVYEEIVDAYVAIARETSVTRRDRAAP